MFSRPIDRLERLSYNGKSLGPMTPRMKAWCVSVNKGFSQDERGESVALQVPSQTMQFIMPANQAVSEILQILGEPDRVAARALRHYLLDVCLQRLEQARQQIARYEQQYGSDYETFNRHVGTDESFLATLNSAHPLWEVDAVEWAYRVEEEAAWQNRSETILRTS